MQNNYPIAPHSYFSISNYEVAKKAFLSDHIENPIFEYPKRFNAKTVAKRITLSNSNPSAVRELNLVRLAIAMQKDSGFVDKFRAANLDLYGEPKRFFYGAALNYYLRHLDSKSTDVNNQILAKLFGNFLSNPRPYLSAPSPKVFRLYRKYANEYFQSLAPSSSLLEAMEKTFQLSHLQDKSWQLVQKSNIKTAKVSRRPRSIFYNPNYVVRSHRNGFNSIAVHEIFGHAFRYSSSHLQYSQGESEGWALFLEQVCAKKFHYNDPPGIITFSRAHMPAPTPIATGNVIIHPVNIFIALVQRTPLTRCAIPTPIMLDDITCPVEMGMPNAVEKTLTAIDAVCATYDCNRLSANSFLPMAYMSLNPPVISPKAIAAQKIIIIHTGNSCAA